MSSKSISIFQPVWLMLQQHLYHRYRGSVLGGIWLFFQPLLYVLLFAIVFSQFMVMRFDSSAPKHAYVIYLISGLLLWNAFINTVLQLSTVYQQYGSYLRKIPLSLLIFPIFIPLLELVIWLIGMTVFAIFLLVIDYQFSWIQLYLFPLVLMVLILAYGLGLIAAVLNTFIPDVSHILQALQQVFFWATPIVYLKEILPNWAQYWLKLNPLADAVGYAQTLMLWHQLPGQSALVWCMIAVVICLFAFILLKRSERVLRDLL